MNAPSDEDVALIQEIINCVYTSKSIEVAIGKLKVLDDQHANDIDEQRRQRKAHEFETSYQRLLTGFGGDADRLARMLYAYSLEIMPSGIEDGITNKKDGRPPDKWGRDGAGKWMFYYWIEQIRNGMRNEGTARPKIKDAVARYLKVPPQHRGRAGTEARIRDYAARYSEAKRILKTAGKLPAIK
jgi:hypothetical protein